MPFGLRQIAAQMMSPEEREALITCATVMLATCRRLRSDSEVAERLAAGAEDMLGAAAQTCAPEPLDRADAEREFSAFIDAWQRAVACLIRSGAYAIEERAAEIGVRSSHPARWRLWANRLAAASRRQPQTPPPLRLQSRPHLELVGKQRHRA